MAAFPTSVATDSDLYIAVNAVSTQLTDNPLSAGATTVNVTSTAAFPTVGFISIDNEIIKYTGKTGTSFTGCTRAADGTSASSHVQNSQVFHNVIAVHHNALKDDLIAAQQFISDIIGRVSTQIKGPDGTVSLPGHSFANDTDTGMYRLGANSLGLATNGGLALSIDASNTVIERGQLFHQNGSASLPSMTFNGDADTGIYRPGANECAIAAGGNVIADFLFDGTNRLVTAGSTRFQIGDGTTALPAYSFSGDTDTGIFRGGANRVDMSVGGSNFFTLNTTQLDLGVHITCVNGTAASPTYTFTNFPTTGIFTNGTNSFRIAVNGVQMFSIDTATINLEVQTLINQGLGVSTPGLSFGGDGDTGLYWISANKFAVATGGLETVEFGPTGTANATTYTPLRFFGGNFTSNFDVQATTGVTTSAVTILTMTNDGGMFLVYGKQTAGGATEFIDIVLCGAGSATVTTVASNAIAGASNTRTYSVSGSALRVAMGANTYTIRVNSLQLA